MLQKVVYLSILIFCLTINNQGFSQDSSDGQTAEYVGYGVKFNYPTSYKRKVQDNKNHLNIFLQGPSFLSVQIFKALITPQLRNAYVKSYVRSLEGNNFTLKNKNITSRKIRIKVENKGSIDVKASYVRLTFELKNEGKTAEMITNLHFFSYGEKGYAIGYSYMVGSKLTDDFKTLSRSFTILTNQDWSGAGDQ